MTNPLTLGIYLIDADQVSFVGPLDKTIQHSTQKASIVHWFLIVVGGRDIQITHPDEKILADMRTVLVSEVI